MVQIVYVLKLQDLTVFESEADLLHEVRTIYAGARTTAAQESETQWGLYSQHLSSPRVRVGYYTKCAYRPASRGIEGAI